MLGLGEEREEIIAVLKDLRAHDCDMLTIGQYLQPSRSIYRWSDIGNLRSSSR